MTNEEQSSAPRMELEADMRKLAEVIPGPNPDGVHMSAAGRASLLAAAPLPPAAAPAVPGELSDSDAFEILTASENDLDAWIKECEERGEDHPSIEECSGFALRSVLKRVARTAAPAPESQPAGPSDTQQYRVGYGDGVRASAKLCDEKYQLRALAGYPREASTARSLAEEIRNLQSTAPVLAPVPAAQDGGAK